MRRDMSPPPQPKGWRAGQHSFSRLWIVLPDNRTLTFHSLDWRSPRSKVRDQALGVKRFEKLLANPRYAHQLAIIYDAATNEKLAAYRWGAKVKMGGAANGTA